MDDLNEILVAMENLRGNICGLEKQMTGEIKNLTTDVHRRFDTVETVLCANSAEAERRYAILEENAEILRKRLERQDERVMVIERSNPGSRLDNHSTRIRALELAWAKYAVAVGAVVFVFQMVATTIIKYLMDKM